MIPINAAVTYSNDGVSPHRRSYFVSGYNSIPPYTYNLKGSVIGDWVGVAATAEEVRIRYKAPAPFTLWTVGVLLYDTILCNTHYKEFPDLVCPELIADLRCVMDLGYYRDPVD